MNQETKDQVRAQVLEERKRLGYEPGIYRLRERLENPFADKRTKHDWRLASEWEKGMLFAITEEWEYKRLEIFKFGSYRHQNIFIERTRDWPRDQYVVEKLVPLLENITHSSLEWEFEWWFCQHSHSEGYGFELLKRAFVERRLDVVWLSQTSELISKRWDEVQEERKGTLEGDT